MIVSPQLYPGVTGGVEVFNYYFIQELATKDNIIEVISYCSPEWNNTNISNIKLSSKLLFKTPLTLLKIFLIIKKIYKKVDFVYLPYTSNSNLIYPILIAKKFFNIKYIVTIHGGGMHQWKRKKLQKSFFLNSEKIIAVSTIIKKEYEKRTKRNIDVIPPLIPFKKSKFTKNVLRKKYGFEDKDTVILCLGSIKKIKGNDILLQAFFNLELKYIQKNHLKLLYVGEGIMKKSLQEQVNEKSYRNSVKFLGNVNHDKIPDMYKISDIYIIPSLFEGTPITLLEAMFNELPIIGSNTNGINNIIVDGENGLLFQKENFQHLTEKIRILVEKDQLYNNLQKKAKETYEKSYNYNEIIDMYLQIFQEIAAKK